jgi:AraC-like DNA-binding protein
MLRLVHQHFREAAPGFDAPPHAHRSEQWFLCRSGGLTVTADGRVCELGPFDGVLIAPGKIRSVLVGTRASSYLVTMFTGGADLDLASIRHQRVALPEPLRDEAVALMDEVRQPGGGDSARLVQALVTRLIIASIRGAPRAERVVALNPVANRALVARIEAILRGNLARDIRRREIAATVGLSEPHLARIFRAATGRSVIDRLIELRIEHAQRLLRESTMSITEIACEVGMTSFSWFAARFRRSTGLSPSDYRRAGGRVYLG